jgi:SAM-dependent methyltransferase
LLDADQVGQPELELPLRLFICDCCGLAQLPSVDVDQIDLRTVHGHGAAFSSTVLAHLREWADMLISVVPVSRSASVLDVSSGDGALLRPFFERGMHALGLEADGHVAAGAQVPTRQEFFDLRAANDIVAAHGQFDLVLVNHALAHASDLSDFVAGLARAVRPGGTIAIEFHHALSLVRGHFDVVGHAHRSYLSLHALQVAMAQHGLQVVDAKQIELHGGSVRAMAAQVDSDFQVQPSVGEVLAIERTSGLDTPAGYTDMGSTAERVRSGLRAFLDHARSNRATVVAYGAPNRGTTLLNYCQVTPAQIAFTVDRSPAKQGHFLPGCHLAVLSPEAIQSKRPDYILVLPWSLSDEIVEQMSTVRDWGGRFVVAVPELCILS